MKRGNYTSTKGDTDTFDTYHAYLQYEYRRWSIRFFYGMLDQRNKFIYFIEFSP